MKVLFATFDGGDYLASMLWDGLQEVLGAENVRDAGDNRFFHRWPYDLRDPNEMICSTRATRHGRPDPEDGYDLLVLNAAFLRDHDWHWALGLRKRLKPTAKIAYVEGWDASWEVHDPATECQPSFAVDAIFRREIDPNFAYPYACHHLDFAAPARWFEETKKLNLPRDIDVYFAGSLHSNPLRSEMLRHAIGVSGRHKFVFAADCPFSAAEHHRLLRRSKIALVPPGAENCNCLRCWEALACGAIPVFVGHPTRRRELSLVSPGWCRPSEVVPTIDRILERNWPADRQAVWNYARAHHTTRARAEKLLTLTMGSPAR